jgi:hypothetical protein
MAKVLIDRTLLAKIEKALYDADYHELVYGLQDAVQSAPPAVIPIEKTHDELYCPAFARPYFCKLKHPIDKCDFNDCPQICKE